MQDGQFPERDTAIAEKHFWHRELQLGPLTLWKMNIWHPVFPILQVINLNSSHSLSKKRRWNENIMVDSATDAEATSIECTATAAEMDATSASSTAATKMKHKAKGKANSIITCREQLLYFATRGGLSEPSEACYSICALAYLYFKQIAQSNDLRQQFLQCNNQRRVFVKKVTKHVTNDPAILQYLYHDRSTTL